MKKFLRSILLAVLISITASLSYGQDGYQFTPVKELKATPVKNQYRSGTCWSFSGISFLEAELLKMGKGEYDLSDMFVVRCTYLEKAIKYVRMHGNTSFAGGGQFHDIAMVMNKYGMVPESVYSGLLIGEKNHVHGEIDEVLKTYVDAIVKNKNKKLSQNWIPGFEGILDAYFGKIPAEFTYNGKKYTPRSFADQLGLKLDDYVYVSSYTHHPFYTTFAIEIPDNWAWGHVQNVPMNDMMTIIDNSINNGYTVGWATDVSEQGFSWAKGIAIIPEKDMEDLSDLERAKWSDMSKEEKDALLYHMNKPGTEKKITQELRQETFDNYLTTDDHGMHITGIAKDQNGTKYYQVKNSWGTTGNPYQGYLYASESFVQFKTISLMVNKNAIPKDILKKIQN
jgi:bleomycin hydrolase